MSDMEVRYPDVEVQLIGASGNAGSIMGSVARALKSHGVPVEEIDEYRMESMSGDYNHLIQTAMRWVSVY